jgi:hypothetical protein
MKQQSEILEMGMAFSFSMLFTGTKLRSSFAASLEYQKAESISSLAIGSYNILLFPRMNLGHLVVNTGFGAMPVYFFDNIPVF